MVYSFSGKKLVHMIRFNKFFDTLFLIVASILLSILIFSCGNDNDQDSNDINNDSLIELDSKEDSTGNLIIVNQLTDQILLYHSDNILLKKIPALTRFRVYVPVDEVNLETLKVWKKSNTPDPLLPNNSNLYRTWNVDLINSSSEQDIVTWVISDQEIENSVGELLLNYPLTDATGSDVIYNADLYLNDTLGLLTTTLVPGTIGKKVGLDFGFYDLNYLFWFQSEDRVNISWSDNTISNDQNSAVINSNNPSRVIEIEPYYGSSIGRKGKIKIINNTDDYLRIVFNDSIPLEAIEMLSLPSTGLSLLYPNGGNFTFTIPENIYSLQALDINTETIYDLRENVYIMELHEYVWNIVNNSSYSEISITNNSGQDLTIHNLLNNDYLGMYVPNNESILHYFPDSITSLIAKNLIQDQDSKLNEITSIWRIDEVFPAFYVSLESSSIQDGDVSISDEVEFSWSLGTNNQNVSFELLNTNFNPHSIITVIDSPITNVTYKYLDDNNEGEYYTFRLNSNSEGDEEYGWQEISFQVDAVQSNGVGMFPMQSQINYDSLNATYLPFKFDIFLEDVDSLAALHIELEFDSNIFSIEQDSILKGELFSNCSDPIIIFNNDVNQTGKLQINVSLIGEDCQFIAGSGILFNITMLPRIPIEVEETFIHINSNSSLRDKYNSIVPISNILLNYPLIARIEFN